MVGLKYGKFPAVNTLSRVAVDFYGRADIAPEITEPRNDNILTHQTCQLLWNPMKQPTKTRLLLKGIYVGSVVLGRTCLPDFLGAICRHAQYLNFYQTTPT